MTLAPLADWLRKALKVRVVSDIKRDNIKGLQRIGQQCGEIRGQIIPQAYHFKEYDQSSRLGYMDIILTLYASNYTDFEVVEFAKTHRLFAVTMPVKRARTGLPTALKQLGIFVYAHTVNDPALEQELPEHGVDGFYTDSLTP